ncbi:oxygen-insensitive NADPH nitroreductase [Vibrio cincinnatiensis]|jgi:nitroreductase|uniref:Nitroreductase n=1 Tax=Vibrio cincinnatiensis DSM 19608 TaxID=1123491 RepID=A0A1T4SI48_VIBCI|nr:oxygen-insensitive NADPH nitroreductase [Vibrio cincinnatiensis]MCG3724002.1 oxygen-insensitive NADPH nitroreductase [Vibrio cincinnatiensis]MCG3734514.1 oxygen-insensitive NADPH nitroreductase [Vibrio cincinnatiensis]MCG3738679.1 oxygen-insensitive NADPH nitroreductase [Vibrio cincinnatiensis]MCG3745378.1 oxygen-insensitive NADPH nitroreductase [Vibrio cincinnatiensis]SKA27990.1 nitroreductase [Vibrio cincinnatiensis DSM 19608]
MNKVIETIQAHRSIRAFKEQPISQEQLDSIIASGIAASSSSLIQAISIIRVTDKEKRAQLAKLAGHQPYVESAAEFLVFCIDYQRHHSINNEVKPEYMELTLIGAIDAGIMAQNCLLAAESMALGGVYIGGLRNSPNEVDKLLQLPPYSAVLFGLCLGYPDQNPELKPRLSPKVILHENSYQPLNLKQIEQYDQTMNDYYQARSTNTKQQGWSEQICSKLSQESRPFILDYLNKKGLAKK